MNKHFLRWGEGITYLYLPGHLGGETEAGSRRLWHVKTSDPVTPVATLAFLELPQLPPKVCVVGWVGDGALDPVAS